MKASEIEKKLIEADIYPSTLSIRKGVVTFRKGFFYTHGNSAVKYAEAIKRVFPQANILETQDIWTAFRGGASVAKSSHFLVKFEIPKER